jgi:hypothetical protein
VHIPQTNNVTAKNCCPQKTSPATSHPATPPFFELLENNNAPQLLQDLSGGSEKLSADRIDLNKIHPHKQIYLLKAALKDQHIWICHSADMAQIIQKLVECGASSSRRLS